MFVLFGLKNLSYKKREIFFEKKIAKACGLKSIRYICNPNRQQR